MFNDLCGVKFTITAKILGTGVGIQMSRRTQGETNNEMCYDIVMQIKQLSYFFATVKIRKTRVCNMLS